MYTLRPFSELYRNKPLIYSTAIQALRARFIGNALGAIWIIVYPLIFLAMYSLVFIKILDVRLPGLTATNYVLTIFSGLVPFLAFSEAFGVGSLGIVSNRSMLKNTLFPIEFIVVRDVIVGHAMMAVGMILVWISAIYDGNIYLSHLLIPLIYMIQILLTIGLVWIVASLVVFFRDLQQVIPIFILFLMLVSPIAYTEDMVPEGMRYIYSANPLAWLMNVYRSCLLDGTIPTTQIIFIAIFSVITFILGYNFITRMKPVFSDYV